MPNDVIKSFAKRSGKSVEEVEKMWKQAKAEAQSQVKAGKVKQDAFYAYATGIVKKMLKLEGVLTYLPTIKD